MMKLTLHKDTGKKSFTESPQSKPVKFCYISRVNEDEFKQISPPSKCRDFLTDVLLHSAIGGFNYPIYSFSYNTEDGKVSRKEALFGIEYPEDPNKKMLSLFSEWEAECGLNRTTITRVDNNNLIVVGDKKWVRNTTTVSLYTLLIRLLFYKFDREFETFDVFLKLFPEIQPCQDARMIKDITKCINIKYFTTNINNFSKGLNAGGNIKGTHLYEYNKHVLHDSGILTFSRMINSPPKDFDGWYKEYYIYPLAKKYKELTEKKNV